MTCSGVTVPPLADQDITKLHIAWSDQRQQCSMAPSVKQEMHQTVTMPLSIEHESYHITPPFMKQELHPTMKMPFVRRQQTRHVTSPCIKREDPLPDNLDLDDSLTSLNWLHDIKMMKIGQPTPPSSPTPLSYANRQTENLPTYIQKQQLILMNESCGLDSQSDIFRTQCLQDSIDYRENGWVKPPYSYATLIWMAMKDSQKSKITLSAIYKWITDNFKYYRTAEPSWQNSIRHNLSLNKCFQKVPRGKDEPGKGGFWRIDPVHAELLESGIWKKRRALSLLEMEYEPMKRIRMSSLDQPSELSLDPPLVLDVPQYLPQSESDGEAFEIEVKPKFSKPKRHKSKSKKRSKSKRPKSSKQARESFPKEDSSTSEDDNLPSSVLNGTFQWESIFDSEIEIDGVRVRAEAILNPNGEVQLLPIVDSPPHSEENEEFSLFLDEDPLDLSIKGTHIPKPLWFESQIQSRLEETEAEQTVLNESTEDLFGMRDLPPSPASSLDDQMTHPWAESRDPVEDIYFEEFLNLEDSGHLVGVSGTWAPDHAIQTIVIENDK